MNFLRSQRGHIAKSAAILLLVAAFLSPAFAEYQQTQTPHFRHEFYVQSGVLSKEEIEAATEAMKVVAGNVPDLKPVTSGRQTLPSGGRSFAFFDTSYRKVSDHAETATRVECRKSSYATPWSCEPPFIAVRITNDGVTREVGFSIKGNPPYGQPYLPDDPRTAGDIVEFVHSPCFAAKYAEAARPGDPQASASPSILGMFRSAGAIRVRLGERLAWEDYDLERTLGAQDGCAFRITHMDRPSDRALLREQELKRYEEKAAKARAEWRKKEQEMEAHALDSGRRRGVGLAFFYASLLAGLPALFLPGLVKKLGAGRWVVATTAGVLTLAFWVLSYLHGQRGLVGNEGLVTLLLMLLTSVYTVGLLLWAAEGEIIRSRAVTSKRYAWILWIAGLAFVAYKLGPWFLWPK